MVGIRLFGMRKRGDRFTENGEVGEPTSLGRKTSKDLLDLKKLAFVRTCLAIPVYSSISMNLPDISLLTQRHCYHVLLENYDQ